MNYQIRLQVYPRPYPLQPLYRAQVITSDGHPIATTKTAYEANGGCGMAAAIGEAQSIIDSLVINDRFFGHLAENQASVNQALPPPIRRRIVTQTLISALFIGMLLASALKGM